MSRKAQTTRHRITGIPAPMRIPNAVFVDTPGFQTKFSNALNRAMNRGVTQTLADDVVVFVVEAGRFDASDRAVLVASADRPVILRSTRLTVSRTGGAAAFLGQLGQERDFAAVVPISAARAGRPTNSWASPQAPSPRGTALRRGRTHRQIGAFLAAEYVRRSFSASWGRIAPRNDRGDREIRGGGSLRRIYAAIVVDRDSHKAIVIGKGGESSSASPPKPGRTWSDSSTARSISKSGSR